MMKLMMLGWATLLVVACAGDPDPIVAEARKFGAECVTVTDTGATDCDSGVCTDAFDTIGHNVCSQKCPPGDGSMCPAGSEGMKCNMKGYCKP